MFFVDVNIYIVKHGKNQPSITDICKHYYEKEKDSFLLISKTISFEEKICNEINVKANICDKAKLLKTNNIYFEIDRKGYVVMKMQRKNH